MRKPIKYVEKAVTVAAQGAWVVFDRLNRIKPNPSPTPKWSDKPLLKSYEKSKPPLGWPRSTDSLCPKCVPEIRQQILDGKLPHEVLMNEKIGEIKATIVERDGKILMVKDCPKHGHFEDVMSIDTEFSKHLEDVFPGRDIAAHNDEQLHHDVRSLLHGREPGRLRPRTAMGRNQDHARQRDHHQTASSDERAVLRWRTNAEPVLPRRGSLRQKSRIQLRPGCNERNRIRKKFRVLPAGSRSRHALRLPPIRRNRQRRQRSPHGR